MTKTKKVPKTTKTPPTKKPPAKDKEVKKRKKTQEEDREEQAEEQEQQEGTNVDSFKCPGERHQILLPSQLQPWHKTNNCKFYVSEEHAKVEYQFKDGQTDKVWFNN